uniref:3-deoxy-D-manno-octulosonic acid transferase n=1 Tax=Sulfurihydrogenibium sp. TaxID=2053621 RepID=UPI002637265D
MVHLIRFIYNLVLFVGFFIFAPFWILFSKKNGYSVGFLERLVVKTKKLNSRPVWIHCASTGEIKTALPIINYISSQKEVLLTVFSPRSYEFAKKYIENVNVVFLPFDFGFLIRKFLKVYKPKVLIIEEGEFWFNLIYFSSKEIPVLSINTRLPKNINNIYYKEILNRFSKFIVKNIKDKELLSNIVSEDRITVCGNLKLLSQINQKNINLDKAGRKIILAGSTHNPEEEILIQVFDEIKRQYPEISLVLAPRHIERVKEIINLINKYGFSYSLRSNTTIINTDIYIVDTVGELSSLYKFADAVFVGGTIAKVGGHNIFEPILSGKKVIIGKNFSKIQDLVEEAKNLN